MGYVTLRCRLESLLALQSELLSYLMSCLLGMFSTALELLLLFCVGLTNYFDVEDRIIFNFLMLRYFILL